MNYKKYNDYELIYMVREHDEDSNDILYQKYIPIIHHLANSFYQSNKYYGYDYDDFVQEATLAFYKALTSFDEKENTLFYTFVILCIRRKLISFSERISTHKNNVLLRDYLSIDEIEFEDRKANIESLMKNHEVEKIIKQFIYSLSFERSCIFELKYNGFSYREISQLLEIPISSIEFKYRTSKERVKILLSDYFDRKVKV